jgi:uncharacterized protein (DUF2249 family)
MSNRVVTLDVREDIKRGREPFSRIMRAVGGLGDKEDLLLIAPFEPKPLFGVLAQQGFSHSAKVLDGGDWEVLFSRQPGTGATGPAAGCDNPRSRPRAEKGGAIESQVVDVDARRLEPPEPLVRILEAVAALPAGAELRAHTDRRPMHLYSQLEERGFTGQTEEQADGSFITHIRAR